MDTYSQILFHGTWLSRIRRGVKNLSYISHVNYKNSDRYAMKVIIGGTEYEFPLEGNPKFMVDENYQDLLKELQTY